VVDENGCLRAIGSLNKVNQVKLSNETWGTA